MEVDMFSAARRPRSTTEDAVWRYGTMVVAERGAVFPRCCVKTGRDEGGRTIRWTVAWVHPAIYLALLVSVVVFLLLVLVLSRRSHVTITVSEEVLAARRHGIILTCGLIVMGITSAPLSLEHPRLAPLFLALCALCLIAAFVTYVRKVRLLYPTRIRDGYVWLRGASPEFLARLPVVPRQLTG